MCALIYLMLVATAAYSGRAPWSALLVYAVLSVITFFAYGWDKSSAKLGRWRTAESTLHFLGLVGGWPGGAAAQRYFRHKSSKREFLLTFWMTVVLNILAFSYLVASGDAESINKIMRPFWGSAV